MSSVRERGNHVKETNEETVIIGNADAYAMLLLSQSGGDCYTYWGVEPEALVNELKEAFPDGMPFPYVDVANAILNITRPPMIYRPPWHVVWDNGSATDIVECEDFEEAKAEAFDILLMWQADWTRENGSSDGHAEPTDEEKESWNEMVRDRSVSVHKYNEEKDEYEEFWVPSPYDLEQVNWTEME